MKFDDLYESILNELGKGWDADSVKKFAKTIGHDPKSKGFHGACVARMKGDMEDPDGWCANIKDTSYGSTYWRGKGKSKKDTEKDVKDHPNVNEDGVYVDNPEIMKFLKDKDDEMNDADKKDIINWAKKNNRKK